MVNSLRERRRQMLRDEILNAAQTLMSTHGYAHTSMEELATRVGISKPTLYSHFATKDEIVVAVVTREMAYMLALIEADAEEHTPLERLRMLMRRMTETIQGENSMALSPWPPEMGHLMRQHEDVCNHIHRISAATLTLIQSAIARDEIDPSLDPTTVMRAFFSLATSLKMAHLFREQPPDPNAAETLITIYERGGGANQKNT